MTTTTTEYHGDIMMLSIYIDNDDELKEKYVDAVKMHNEKVLRDGAFYDSGFDLFLPSDQTHFNSGFVNKVDFKVKCCAQICKDSRLINTPFYTYARSSLSKTPLRLANNQGIIDAGYRGNLIGMFDMWYSDCVQGIRLVCKAEKLTNDTGSNFAKALTMPGPYSRILQICAPGLIPIWVQVVDTVQELGATTSRGDGGFGSTGK